MFVPRLELAGRVGPDGAGTGDVFGGVPPVVPTAGWPSCASCGTPLSHVATWHHDAARARLDLHREGSVLTIYQCENEEMAGVCPVWEADSGANYCRVLTPGEQLPWDGGAPAGVWVYPECRVTGWDEVADGSTKATTRLGGSPEWMQAPATGLDPAEFVAQIDHGWDMQGPAPTAAELGYPVFDNVRDVMTSPDGSLDGDDRSGAVIESWGWYVLGPNLAFGLAYVFLDRTVDPPKGLYLAQQ